MRTKTVAQTGDWMTVPPPMPMPASVPVPVSAPALASVLPPAPPGEAIPSPRRSLACCILILLCACTPQGDPGIGSVYVDHFDRAQLGSDWNQTGGNWAIEDGELHVVGARNHPLWLLRTLPRDVRVEFDVRSETPDGDIKVEIFGDGASFAKTDSYTATSYVIIFGGWRNSRNILARMDEHGADRVVGEPRKVETSRTYHLRIERVGPKISVWVDDELLLEMIDSDPLQGRGHDHFAFNNWQSDLWFDNLEITPL